MRNAEKGKPKGRSPARGVLTADYFLAPRPDPVLRLEIVIHGLLCCETLDPRAEPMVRTTSLWRHAWRKGLGSSLKLVLGLS